MMWHVVFAESGRLPRSRAARSRDSAIQTACELLDQSFDVRRVIEPSGAFIERPEMQPLPSHPGGRPGACYPHESSGGERRADTTITLRYTAAPHR
jgi:hypothetical protein